MNGVENMAPRITALVKAQDKIKNLTARNKATVEEVERSRIPAALGLSAAFLTGSFAGGVTEAVAGDEIAGFPTDLAVALLSIGAGIGMGSPYAIAFGVGLVADQARDYGYSSASNFFTNRSDATSQFNTSNLGNTKQPADRRQ
jgi:hypothetical protein